MQTGVLQTWKEAGIDLVFNDTYQVSGGQLKKELSHILA